MVRLRFPIPALATLVLGAVCTGLASPALAQDARINDIEISRDGDKVSILVKLSGQPSAASASSRGDALAIEIDGVALPTLAFTPPAGLLVSQIAATPSGLSGSRLTLQGAAFGAASTTIYRNAVLIETTLAEAMLPQSASLLGSTSQTPRPETSAAAVIVSKPVAGPSKHPEPAHTPQPVPQPASVKPTPISAAVHEPVMPQTPAPTRPTPPVAPRVPKAAPVASLVALGPAECSSAAIEVERDPWALGALGEHALCLIDAGKVPEATNRLEQLAAFSPEDWRVSLGRAALSTLAGDASNAEIGYRNAAMLAPDQPTREAIARQIADLARD